jgi:EAL domain-containing protein (putative c-di-GMP-specific phosphodiesterase class I)
MKKNNRLFSLKTYRYKPQRQTIVQYLVSIAPDSAFPLVSEGVETRNNPSNPLPFGMPFFSGYIIAKALSPRTLSRFAESVSNQGLL